MKNAFDGLIGRLDTAEKKLSGLEDVSREVLKNKKHREQGWKTKRKRITKDYGVVTETETVLRIQKERERKGQNEYFRL